MAQPLPDDLDASYTGILQEQSTELVNALGSSIPGAIAANWLRFWLGVLTRVKNSLGRIITTPEAPSQKAFDDGSIIIKNALPLFAAKTRTAVTETDTYTAALGPYVKVRKTLN